MAEKEMNDEKPEVNEQGDKEDGSDDLDFEDAREGNDDVDENADNEVDDDEQLMVIETPEGLTLVEPAENSSFYIVQEHEGQETPPGTIKWVMQFKLF
ncbi:prothymosin alpha-A-like [Orbicella faveolata]|uniref:prothymosin alpha-A-like n=1 Tax=Orbicella faveolata TaxID=48498 RepID=UPI0009E2F19E|nr:prothymosin alpha-A-like [Orbicella faveolata]